MKKLTLLFLTLYTCCFAQTLNYKVENLGANVNSSSKELSPVISADGNTLFFTRQGHSSNWSHQDAWMSTKSSNDTWTLAEHLGKPINSRESNGSVSNISTDNNQIIMRGAYEDGEYSGSGFSVIKLNKKGEWGDPKKLEIRNFQSYVKGSYTNLYLCKDGKTLLLYFSEKSNPDEAGDIYVSHLVEREKWTKAKSLKDIGKFFNKAINHNTWTEPEKIGTVNTPNFDETTPFLAADGVTLYFSSNRTGGYGSNDIWMAKRLDSTYKKWSEPVNLGPKINTKNWDAYYTLDAKGDFAYMVSSNDVNSEDIVKVKTEEEIKPNPVVLIRGKVFNSKTKEPIGANIEYENLINSKNEGVATSNAKTGDYTIVLPYGINYGFLAYNQGFISVSDNLDLTKIASYQEITRDLYLSPLEVGTTIRLNNIFFDINKATLRPESFPELDRLVELLETNSKLKIEISGHTDNVGGDDANLKLSNDRAKTVMDYVIDKGVNASKLNFKGYGKTKPIATNDTEEGKQQNRRVEFTIL